MRKQAVKRHSNNQRRFLAHQVVHILAVRVVTEELGMSLEGAIEMMEGMDVERFLAHKRRSGEAVLTEDHLKELITNQLSFKLQRVFGVEEKKDFPGVRKPEFSRSSMGTELAAA